MIFIADIANRAAMMSGLENYYAVWTIDTAEGLKDSHSMMFENLKNDLKLFRLCKIVELFA